MGSDFNIKFNRFWEKYAVLEKFNQKYDKKRVPSIDQTIQFLSDVFQISRLHPFHKKVVAEKLQMRIQRQKAFYRIAMGKND